MNDLSTENLLLTERLMLASEAADLGVWDWDLVEDKMTWDHKMYLIYGIPNDSSQVITYSRVCSFIDAGSVGHLEPQLEKLIQGRLKGLDLSFKIIRENDKASRVIRARGTAIFDKDGSVKRVIGVNIDITDIVEAERKRVEFEEKILQTQKLESLGVMAGGIAHDFNNLLSAIRSNIELAILDSGDESPAKEYLSEINSITLRASELCSQMMVYSGQQTVDRRAHSLQDVFHEMEKLIRISVRKNVSVALDLPDDPAIISCDIVQIRQLILNLIINASESIPKSKHGKIKIEISPCNGIGNEYDQSWLNPENKNKPEGIELHCISISDNGSGMPEDTLKRIFDPFFTTKFTGRGLGLAAVLGILKSHAAAITVKSKLDQGTTFTLYFPKSYESLVPEQIKTPPPAFDWKTVGKVLLADDEDAVRHACERILKRHDLDVQTFDNGKSLLDAFKENPSGYSLVILDLTMPEMSGDTVYREINKLNPSIPVIIMSGYHQNELSDQIRKGSVLEYIQKPFSIETFTDTIQHSLQAAQPS